MKQVIHHWHSNPPCHGVRYYGTLFGVIVGVGVAYLIYVLARQSLA